MIAALDGYEALELTERARQVSDALARTLPADRARAIEILMDSVTSEIVEERLSGMDYWPHVSFVANHGIECFETSMRAQYELTQRFTAEFSMRPFLERYPQRTLARLRVWATDPNKHVRRLVSEGTRPRLPWASRLKRFQEDPEPVVELLEVLKDDPEEYVRRSVANNLNDIAKDHPDRVIEIARRWWTGGSEERRRLVRHGLRTLIKQGHPGALHVLGYPSDSPAEVVRVTCAPKTVEIGGKIRIEVEIVNRSAGETAVLADLRVHFMKANGSTRPKVFKGSELRLAAGETGTVRKTISLAQHSTRRHYPGTHRIEVMINGDTRRGTTFDVT
jgi:3-methyladenine DNA glycosylase AlkC